MVEIFKGELKHSKTLTKIAKQSFLEAHGHSASKEDIENYVSKNFNQTIFKNELLNPYFIYHLISYKNEIVGYSKIVLNMENSNIQYKNVTKLERLYLLKDYYSLKLGAKLFDYNVNLSAKNNQKGIWLAVWVENYRAINFYTKSGFKIVGKYDFQISETHTNPNHIMYLQY